MDVSIEKHDGKHFPRTCCGVVYKNSKTYMEHFLPAHEVPAVAEFCTPRYPDPPAEDRPGKTQSAGELSYVVKRDGANGGKGVLVTTDFEEAMAAVDAATPDG